ncbi:hypothetical protein ABZ595_14065 [Streptomyces rubradiris]|uniref:hypothetical protein n=1 Tax=Streptomyces rubradiris TaxID=285531 RepID=UPI0033D21C5B
MTGPFLCWERGTERGVLVNARWPVPGRARRRRDREREDDEEEDDEEEDDEEEDDEDEEDEDDEDLGEGWC